MNSLDVSNKIGKECFVVSGSSGKNATIVRGIVKDAKIEFSERTKNPNPFYFVETHNNLFWSNHVFIYFSQDMALIKVASIIGGT